MVRVELRRTVDEVKTVDKKINCEKVEKKISYKEFEKKSECKKIVNEPVIKKIKAYEKMVPQVEVKKIVKEEKNNIMEQVIENFVEKKEPTNDIEIPMVLK